MNEYMKAMLFLIESWKQYMKHRIENRNGAFSAIDVAEAQNAVDEIEYLVARVARNETPTLHEVCMFVSYLDEGVGFISGSNDPEEFYKVGVKNDG